MAIDNREVSYITFNYRQIVYIVKVQLAMNSVKWLFLSHYYKKRIIGGCFTASYRCLSRMIGNYHVVVLRGKEAEMPLTYPTLRSASAPLRCSLCCYMKIVNTNTLKIFKILYETKNLNTQI